DLYRVRYDREVEGVDGCARDARDRRNPSEHECGNDRGSWLDHGSPPRTVAQGAPCGVISIKRVAYCADLRVVKTPLPRGAGERRRQDLAQARVLRTRARR